MESPPAAFGGDDAGGEEKDMDMPRSLRWVLIARGILAVALGVLAIAWPGVTVGVVALLFAAYALVAAGADVVTAIHVDGVGPTVGHLALAALSATAGLAALLWPGATVVLLSWVVAFWALAAGIGEIVLAIRRGITPGRRALWFVGGLVSIALGLALALLPSVDPLSLGVAFGLFSTVYGITVLTRTLRAARSRPVMAAGSAS
ncbi:HdeD family acid-resistance protein [Actinomycetospora rhizophila]|uniref:HdeD family acid-resistance protein n=1 Tax=Actinomycetospora rhizophila TaxID=1416876 RepID=A0ABV9ZBY6_9PSEU